MTVDRLPGRRRAAAAACAAAWLTFGACGNDRPAVDSAETVETAAPTTAPGPTDEGAEFPTPEPYPTWDAQSRDVVRASAREAMLGFARNDRGATAWWRDLAPHLSPAGAVAFHGTDPENVPVHRVTGAAKLVGDSSPYLAQVRVPTDVGGYVVMLSRTGRDAPWLVDHLRPPRALRVP